MKSFRTPSRSSWQANTALLVTAFYATFACGTADDSDAGVYGAGTAGQNGDAANADNGGNGGTSGSAGSDAAGASGASGASARSSSGNSSGSSDAQSPPPPADGGGSVYAVQCRGESRPCGYPAAHCLGIQLPDGRSGFSCSNHCQTAADCATAPTGAEARVGCVPFSQESRCVLVCESGAQRYACPGGMSCYTHPGAELGYCLWL